MLEDGESDQPVRDGIVDSGSAIDHDNRMHTYRCTSAAVAFYRGMYSDHGAMDRTLTGKKVAPFFDGHGRQRMSGNPFGCYVNHFRLRKLTGHFTERKDDHEDVCDLWYQGDVRTES
jgi:hypothetical protein